MMIRQTTAVLATGALLLLVGGPARAFGGHGFDAECWATGIGAIGAPLGDTPQGDVFWGFAASREGVEPQEAEGFWLHGTPRRAVSRPWGVALRRDLFAGDVERVICSPNGDFLVTVRGTGAWNGAPDHPFEVVVIDRSPPGEDVDGYVIRIVDPSGELVYEAEGDVVRGRVTTSGSP